MTTRSGLLLLLCLCACHRLSDEQAIALVNAYDRAVVEAYRTSDPKRAAGTAGEAEQRKLAGLIGVKLDQGITLDSRLLELQVLGVERDAEAIVVRTHERWYYLERRIGTGEKVGDDSTDTYEMRYRLVREGGRWVVSSIEFASPAQVGRREVFSGEARILHGIDTANPGQVKVGPFAPTPPAKREGKGRE